MDIFDPESEPAMALKTQYEDENCRDQFIDAQKHHNISDACKDILVSISMFAFDGGLEKGLESEIFRAKIKLSKQFRF